MRLHRLACLAATIVLMPTASEAELYDPCDSLVEVSEEDSLLRWNLSRLFRRPVPEEAVADVEAGPIYYVTTHAGRFGNVTCDGGEVEGPPTARGEDRRAFEWQEMYPIGIALRKVAELDLPEWTNAGYGTPILVVTEYGHRKVVSDRDIEPIRPDATYIFADSIAESRVCDAAAPCPGNAVSICPDADCRTAISANGGYAVAGPGLSDAARATVDAYRWLRPDRLAITRDTFADEQKLRDSKARMCTPIPVRVFRRGGRPALPAEAHLTFCAKRASEGADSDGLAPFKLIDLASAERLFEHGISASFHRRFGEGLGPAGQVVAGLANVRITATKPCGMEVENVSSLELGGGLNVRASAGILEVDVGAERRWTNEIVETLPSEDFLLFSTYFIEPIPNANLPEVLEPEEDLWIFRIVFRSTCEDGAPAKPASIRVFYDRLPGKSVTITADGDLMETYARGWDQVSFTPLTDAAFLAEGQFWQIADHTGYFIWRDTLRQYFYRIPGTNALISNYPPQQRPLVRDFFVYLMLTAAYHHLEPDSFLEFPL